MLSELINGGVDAFYVVSQIFALAAIVFNLIAVQRRKKSQLLRCDAVAALCNTIHYAFLGGWTGMASKAVSFLRDITATYLDLHKKSSSKKRAVVFVVIFAAFYIVSGAVTFESVFSLLPTVGLVIFTAVAYLGKTQSIRYASGLASALWLIYNIYVFSVMGIIAESVFLINDLIAIWRYRDPKAKKCRAKRKKSPRRRR